MVVGGNVLQKMYLMTNPNNHKNKSSLKSKSPKIMFLTNQIDSLVCGKFVETQINNY